MTLKNKKYTLANEMQFVGEHTLHRIQAIRDFGDVKAGDFGGLIENESNLSHRGNCWVYDDACVFGDAFVMGDACIREEAKVMDSAQVADDATVSGHAIVHGYVYGNATVTGSTFVNPDAVAREHAVVRGQSSLRPHCEISGDAIVENTIIDPLVHISNNACIKTFADYLLVGRIGSRFAYTTFYLTNKQDIWVCCGCFNDSIESFAKAVKNKHGAGRHAKAYGEAIKLAKTILGGRKRGLFS